MVADVGKSELKSLRQNIFISEKQIEEATSKLSNLEAILNSACYEIQSSLGFEFVTMQLIRPEENIIEAVHGIGIAAEWSGRAKHYIDKDPELRDIQADIVQTYRTEIIAGWDERFDRWIYEEYHHERLVRIFTPIVLVQDENGQVIEDWFEQCQWEVIAEEENQDGQHTVIEMRLLNLNPERRKLKVLGTVEAGYQNSQIRIGSQQALALAKLVAYEALEIRKALLPYVLETITNSAMQIVRADSTSLHLFYELDPGRYIYEVCSGCIGQRFLNSCPPRKDGLGRQAVCEGRYKFIPDPARGHDKLALKHLNPKAFAEGIKAIAAFPLLVDRKQGVLYIHFQDEHQFTEDELSWVELFANRAVDAIRHATIYEQMRDRARQLAALHSVAQSLAHMPEEDNLLRHIAWDTLNILAADVVTIYEYIQPQKQFLTPPDLAGRLKAEREMFSEVDEGNTPYLLLERGENVYALRSLDEQIFEDSSFVIRERIKSTAGILLCVGKEVVGVMFINYRRPHHFSDEERQIIETLASSAAIAIKNQRWLQTLSDVDREIITTLDQEKLLSLIMQRAVDITGADLGYVRLLDPIRQELIIKVWQPAHELGIPLKRTKLGEGITGWVALHRKSVLVNDTKVDSRYQSYLIKAGSELCVPLLDQEQRVLGVLNLESYRTGAFDRRHQRMLEALADQTVIAIQNAETKENLVAIARIATLGDLAGPLMHKINSDFGAVQVWAQDILDQGDECSKHIASRIKSVADQVLEEATCLRSWFNAKPSLVDIQQILYNARDRVQIPIGIIQKINVPKDLPKVSGSEQQLTDVFYNLIQNAVDAMQTQDTSKDGGTLSIDSISVERDGKCWVVVKVSDTGVGIAKENHEKIFQPDYSTHAGDRGFGLWWTQAYIKRLGGSITVESDLGKGAQFIVILPAAC